MKTEIENVFGWRQRAICSTERAKAISVPQLSALENELQKAGYFLRGASPRTGPAGCSLNTTFYTVQRLIKKLFSIPTVSGNCVESTFPTVDISCFMHEGPTSGLSCV